MKKLALTIGLVALSASAYADISSGNADLQGWAVEDRNLQSATKRTYAEPVLPFSTGSVYSRLVALCRLRSSTAQPCRSELPLEISAKAEADRATRPMVSASFFMTLFLSCVVTIRGFEVDGQLPLPT